MKRCLPLLCAALGLTAAEPPPDILLLLADDFGYGSCGVNGADPKLLQTPAIDALAAAGARFTDACSPCSVCTPTRYAILTGQYCWRTRLQRGVVGIRGKNTEVLIGSDQPTLPRLLQARGYTTAGVGKWHLGLQTTAPIDWSKPLTPGTAEAGFASFFGLPANHGDPTGVWFENDHVVGLRSTTLTPFTAADGTRHFGLDAPQRVDTEVMDTIVQRAQAVITAQPADTPLFLYVAFAGVHQPVTPAKRFRGTSKAGPYGDWIHELDASVGAILDTLEKSGRAKRTLVVFTSDNGGVYGKYGAHEIAALKAGLAVNGPWKGGKWDIHEGGFRMPTFVRWPDHIPAGRVVDHTWSLVDLTATLCAATGTPLPEAAAGAEDSHDVLAAWTGSGSAPAPHPIVEHDSIGIFAVRDGRWKFVEGVQSSISYGDTLYKGFTKADRRTYRPGAWKLYDLVADPGETKDVKAEHPQEAERLARMLQRLREGTSMRNLTASTAAPASP
jgi:arylsulfatase A-like enzyme